MQPHQQRVVDEKAELSGKIEKLELFVEGAIFESLPAEEQDRLTRQLNVMTEYNSILAERIAAFSSPDSDDYSIRRFTVADSTTYVQPLNGSEIIDDLCGAIAEKLRVDCNLREIDGYSSGYKAKVTIHLEAFGLDTATVDQEISVDEVTPDPANPLQEPDVNLDTELVVEQEPDLSAVRERSGQSEPSIEISAEGPIATGKRKYTRRLKALAAAQGGAVGELSE